MKAAVGISGGVDSAVAAMMLKRRGYEVCGVTMLLGRADETQNADDARKVAERLGIELITFDFAAEWKARVIDYVRDSYLTGLTPNPCVQCNETVKFGLLPNAVFAAGFDVFATGHYARIQDGHLFRGVDHGKDQSYFLYRVAPEILARTEFPLGGMTKGEVRKLAEDFGFEAAKRADSQDFCGGDVNEIVGEEDCVGEIVDESGKVLGRHNGFWHYTIGKRKGLGIGGGIPYYVVDLDAENNRVIVGFRESAVCREFALERVVKVGGGNLPDGEYMVKVRSAGEPKGPVVVCGDVVRCDDGIMGVAPGQSAVLFRGEEVVGGGIIA